MKSDLCGRCELHACESFFFYSTEHEARVLRCTRTMRRHRVIYPVDLAVQLVCDQGEWSGCCTECEETIADERAPGFRVDERSVLCRGCLVDVDEGVFVSGDPVVVDKLGELPPVTWAVFALGAGLLTPRDVEGEFNPKLRKNRHVAAVLAARMRALSLDDGT